MKYTLLLFGILMFWSCQQDDDGIDPTTQEINLKNLNVGNRSHFVRLDGNCGFMEGFGYTQDSILLEITEENGVTYFQESFTKGSPLYETNPNPVRYPVIEHEDFILIPEREESTLFFFYGNDTIHTAPKHEVDLVQSECFQMTGGDVFVGDAIAFIPEFEIHDISLTEQTVVSCVPVFFELEAYLCYQDGKLNLSYTLSSGFPGVEFQGWRLVD